MDAKLLQEYVGKKVTVKITPHTYVMHGKEYDVSDYKVEDDETVLAIRKAVGGDPLRFWTYNHVGTMDWKPDRVNVYIDEKEKEFYITSIRNG